jgi:uncharacterized protein
LAQVVIDDELKAAMAALPGEPAQAQTASSLAQLRKMGFLADDAECDTRAAESWFQRMEADTSILAPTVLTTYSCNFGCTYCVEEGVKKPVFMDEKEAQDSSDYIERKFGELGSREIDLYFYGGEPLLNMPAIRTVARRLHDFSAARGIPFSFGFNTNGALFTREAVGELKPLGLSWARITLDGTRETHDRNRPFRNGRGSFEAIVANISSVAGLMNLDVNMNFDDTNVAEGPALLEYLSRAGLADGIRRLSFSPITPTPRDREGMQPATEADCTPSSPVRARQLIQLRRMALEKGYNVEVAVTTRTCAMTMKRSSFIIDPHGDLYRCGGFAGRKEFRHGNIRAEEKDRFLGSEQWRRCIECAYAPLCGDGCPFGAYIRFGDAMALNCAKPVMEELVRESLKLSYMKKKNKAGT